MSLKIGIAGPVGSGKTSLIQKLTESMQKEYTIGIVTNDIYTTEDADYLKEALSLKEGCIIGVETGGCPHTAIRDDISLNRNACEKLETTHSPEIIFVESGGDNLSATFSYELVDFYMYVIDVAQGGDIPRKKGAGLLYSDLLVINKTDLAPYVNVDLESMKSDTKEARGNKPYAFISQNNRADIEKIRHWLEALLG